MTEEDAKKKWRPFASARFIRMVRRHDNADCTTDHEGREIVNSVMQDFIKARIIPECRLMPVKPVALASKWTDLDRAVALCMLDPGVMMVIRGRDLRYPGDREIVIRIDMLCRALYDYRWSQRHAG